MKIQNLWSTRVGSPYQPAILLIPGCSSTCKDWPKSFIDTINNNGFQTIVLDTRDNGRNSWNTLEPYSLDDMASDISHFMIIERIRHAHVVGISMGGAIAQILAIKEPEKILSLSLVMSTSVRGISDKSMPPPSERILNSIEKEYNYYLSGEIKKGLKQRYNSLAYPEKISDREMNQRVTRMLRHGFNPFCRHVHAFETSPSRTRYFSKILCPTTIIHGRYDELFQKEHAYNIHENLPNSTLHFVDSAHFISEQSGVDIAKIIMKHF